MRREFTMYGPIENVSLAYCLYHICQIVNDSVRSNRAGFIMLRELTIRPSISSYIQIRVVKDPEGKPRGYAFIEFEREKDMKAAYKDADGLKIMGRRIVVDVERGRTVKGWKPKRLGMS